MPTVYIGLVHYPIYNKHDQIVTTALTNFDIHDIARSARTYNIKQYFIIHPIEKQQEIANDIIEYWQNGYGGQHHSDRKEAFQILNLVKNIEDAVKEIEKKEKKKPIIVTTDARIYPNTISYPDLRAEIEGEQRPYLILFGTGWGIQNEVMRKFDYILEPIYGPGDYNHLPVRAAVAIILDRLLGEKWWIS